MMTQSISAFFNALINLVLCGVSLFFIAGCGLKGDLYLPDEQQPASSQSQNP